MTITAPERIYYNSAKTALVKEGDSAAKTLYCKVGDVISAADLVTWKAYFESFGWIGATEAQSAPIQVKSIHVKHDDASGTKRIDLPPRTIIQDVYVQCTEAAAGSPNVDFGEFGGDTDGIMDGLGQPEICDLTSNVFDTTPDFKGRGALITSTNNDDNQRIKARRYYPNGVTLTNTLNSAGTAGEWTIHVLYIILPEIKGV